jgi:hypothetical protein
MAFFFSIPKLGLDWIAKYARLKRHARGLVGGTYCAELWVCRVIVTLMRYFTCIDSWTYTLVVHISHLHIDILSLYLLYGRFVTLETI